MIRVYKSIILGFLISTVAAAQNPDLRQPLRTDVETLLRDSRWRELLDQQTERQAALVERQDEQRSEQKFMEAMRRFVVLWNQFAGEYNQKKVFNMKLAKEVSSAFRKLENTPAWPNMAHKR